MDANQYKQDLLNKLYAPFVQCTRCPLGSQGRTRVVFGSGNPDARLMIIGEGPGQDEDRLGQPFVGRSGQLLTKLMGLAHLERDEAFITNIVKCRPPGNRKPLENEMDICTSLLLFNQIKIIKPQIICTLGATALSGLTRQKNIKITQLRGKLLQCDRLAGIRILPTYHPAYILRNPPELKTLFADLELVATLLSDLKEK